MGQVERVRGESYFLPRIPSPATWSRADPEVGPGIVPRELDWKMMIFYAIVTVVKGQMSCFVYDITGLRSSEA